jgi:hypothetical protein
MGSALKPAAKLSVYLMQLRQQRNFVATEICKLELCGLELQTGL